MNEFAKFAELPACPFRSSALPQSCHSAASDITNLASSMELDLNSLLVNSSAKRISTSSSAILVVKMACTKS